MAVATVLSAALALMSLDRPDYINFPADDFGRAETILLAVIFAGLMANYAVLARWRRPKEAPRIAPRRILAAVLPMSVLLLIAPPLLSVDTTAYVLSAHNWVHHGLDPYAAPLNAVKSDPWLSQIGKGPWWLGHPTAYGPLFYLISVPWVVLGSRSVMLSIYLYKAFLLLLFLASIPLACRLCEALGLSSSGALLYALNPALMVHGIMDGHNDLFMALGTLAVLYAIARGRWAAGALWVGLSAAIKYYLVILLPLTAIGQRRVRVSRLIAATAIVGCVLIAASAPLHFPLLRMFTNLHHFEGWQSPLYQVVPTFALFDAIFGHYSHTAMLIALLLAYGLVVYLTLWRRQRPVEFVFWSVTLVLLMTVPHFGPWYLLASVPAGALLATRSDGYSVGLMYLTFYSLFHFFGV